MHNNDLDADRRSFNELGEQQFDDVQRARKRSLSEGSCNSDENSCQQSVFGASGGLPTNLDGRVFEVPSTRTGRSAGISSSKRRGARCRGYVFTLHDYTAEESERILQIECEYVCFQGEKAPSTLRKHLQGFIRFKNPRDFETVKRLLGGSRVHLEAQKGTSDQCIAYCSKEDTRDPDFPFRERGTRPVCVGERARTDLSAVGSAIQQGRTPAEIFGEFPDLFIKYSKGISAALFVVQRCRDWKTEVRWYYGSTGTGKSRLALQEAKAMCEENGWTKPIFFKAGENKWWDGYEGNEVVIVDDYRCDLCTFATLLRLLDRYPVSIEVKGGMRQFLGRVIFFTTNLHYLEHWEKQKDENKDQLTRRIEIVRNFIPSSDRNSYSYLSSGQPVTTGSFLT